MTRRARLVAILVYLTLDLSLPAMPGAFVFEADDSAEGTRVIRGRLVVEVVALPILHAGSFVLPSPHVDLRQRLSPLSDVVRLARSTAQCLPRAACARSSPSEDPH